MFKVDDIVEHRSGKFIIIGFGQCNYECSGGCNIFFKAVDIMLSSPNYVLCPSLCRKIESDYET